MNRYKYIDEAKQHLHTLDGKPLIGTSTATKIIAKELTWWASGMAVGKMGWVTGKKRINGKYVVVNTPEQRLASATLSLESIKQMLPEAYLSLLDTAYKAHSDYKNQRADAGTDRHALLETYVKECLADGGKPYPALSSDATVQAFIDWSQTNVKRFLWSELHGYSEKLWTGGIADVGWEDYQDRVVAADFKSSVEAYFDQWVQVAGYDLMLSENGGFTKEGDKIFTLEKPITVYCIVPFGQKVLDPQFEFDVEGWRSCFVGAVHLHKKDSEYKLTH